MYTSNIMYGKIGTKHHTRAHPGPQGETFMDGSKFDHLARSFGQATSRRKLLRGLAGGLAGALAGGTLTRRDGDAAGRELVICHATGDPNAPWQPMTIQQAEFNLHARHGDYLRVECCADDDCPNQAGVCNGGECQNGYCVTTSSNEGDECSMPNGDTGFCTRGDCISACPMGATCLFSNHGNPNAEGLCANGVCTCKPNRVAGMCDCGSWDSMAGCCGRGCSCFSGTCLS